MPLGEIHSHARDAEFISSADVRELLSQKFTLTESNASTGGPSRYWNVAGYQSKVGFISPHSSNFCSSCNRVRVTATGRLLLCLGNEHSVDLRAVMRNESFLSQSKTDQITQLKNSIQNSMSIKPEKHEFDLSSQTQILRFMNTTGG